MELWECETLFMELETMLCDLKFLLYNFYIILIFLSKIKS